MSANGTPVSRAEMAAHIRRIDENLDFMRHDIADIHERLTAPQRWLGARAARLVDWSLVAALAATVATVVRNIG